MEERVFELKAGILKVFAQPTRLKILECLRSGEKSIYEVVSAIHGEQSNVSRHIFLMQKNHIATTRKDGVRVMVKVKDPEIFNILDRVSKILKDRFKEQEKLLLEI
jgi:DNA-binding transcriptional ArsR family regulator